MDGPQTTRERSVSIGHFQFDIMSGMGDVDNKDRASAVEASKIAEKSGEEKQKHSFKELITGPGIRFAINGAAMTVIDILLYQLFANVLQVSLFGAPASVSAVWVGTPIVILLNFFISHRFVWKSSTSKRRTIVPFFGMNIFSGILVQSLVISMVIWVLSTLDFVIIDTSITNLFAKCCAVLVGTMINFFGSKFLFKY